jgi:dCTP deaminase
MILTGPEIRRAYAAGELNIDPFDPYNLNPNSYNYHLGPKVLRVGSETNNDTITSEMSECASGFLLTPGHLYLAATQEFIGSDVYVITLLGRSSLGRLGLFLNVTADLGHSGSFSQWTLELKVVQPLRIYPGMRIGQVAFWIQSGLTAQYKGRYHLDEGPIPNRDPRLARFSRNRNSGGA